ncbi:MAG: type IV secretion system protein [Proteobacteria bacterium]|nr:MAG: type IV secretion system protein [Pseudomonadota bacterium]
MSSAQQDPYFDARRIHNEREGNRERRLFVTECMAIILAFAVVIMAVGIVYIGSKSKFVPYVIETDSKRRVISSALLTSESMDYRTIRYELVQWITNYRSVVSDPELQKKYVYKAYSYAAAGSKAKLSMDEWFSSGNNPYARVKEYTLLITHESQIKLSDNSYQIDWTETRRDNGNKVIGEEHFRAIVTYEFKDVTSEMIEHNPFGLFIKTFSIQKVGA